MQQNLTDKIIFELDMIRIMSKLSVFAIQNESKETENDSFELIFEDIEKRCWNISEWFEESIKEIPDN
jgi:hypothetical protein